MLCGLKTILTDMNILNSYRHIRPKKVKYPIPEIPDDSGKKSGTDWVLPKIIGSGIGYPSGTAYDYDCESQCDVDTVHSKEMYDCMDDNYGDDDDP